LAKLDRPTTVKPRTGEGLVWSTACIARKRDVSNKDMSLHFWIFARNTLQTRLATFVSVQARWWNSHTHPHPRARARARARVIFKVLLGSYSGLLHSHKVSILFDLFRLITCRKHHHRVEGEQWANVPRIFTYQSRCSSVSIVIRLRAALTKTRASIPNTSNTLLCFPKCPVGVGAGTPFPVRLVPAVLWIRPLTCISFRD
jgi:hypothetical protein